MTAQGYCHHRLSWHLAHQLSFLLLLLLLVDVLASISLSASALADRTALKRGDPEVENGNRVTV